MPSATETTPLIESSHPPRRLSGTTLIYPLALVCRVATLLPTTTTFFILQQFICRRYYRDHDPARIPPDGHIPDAMCAQPAVEERYAAFIALVALMDGIGSLGGYAALSFLAARFGRRVAMATVITVGLGADIALIASTMVASWLETPLFALWLVCASFSQATLVAFVANIYLVDLVPEESRTSALSSIAGWGALGSVLSFSVGGTITTRSGNVLVVYSIAGILWLSALLYVWLILPESFPKAKREQLRLERLRPQQAQTRLMRYMLRLKRFLARLERPPRDPNTGRRNWRLILCAVHMFFTGLGSGYALPALITIITSLYRYTPEETGYTLTALSATNMLMLAMVIPALVRVLRPIYLRRSNNPEKTTDRLDVHLAFVSWVVEATAYIIFPFMHTRASQFAAVVLIGCGPGYGPAIRSLVAASVEPLKQGETLGMIEMMWGAGLFLSPIVMGSILSATISSVPQTIFYVQAAIVISAAGILLFVRDVDRYREA
ncbi:MFS general substrate transporter [Roridomyces roridus]|uniref:MFS general substrate transporter n=1 Tax=Roridomyces roridus TaxID=1738132 RepID=A0AAD7C7L6_9AGAR|nr:MFS general substrate transporter [Roridomyces roridus]